MPTVPVIDAPVEYDLEIAQGSDFALQVAFQTDTGVAIGDLTGCTVAAKIRADFATGSAVIVAMTGAVTDGPNAIVTLSLTAAQTAALSVPVATPDTTRQALIGYYDAEITDGSKTYRYIQGAVLLSREVTR